MFPCLLLSAECIQGDEWCTIGYELAERANGIPNLGKIIGSSERREATCRDIVLKSANPIRGGVSGSPLFNKRTGSVAGLIKEVTKDTQAFATSIESVLQVWLELKALNLASELLIDPTQSSKLSLPPIWNVPFQRDLKFEGRKEILTHLAIELNSGKPESWKQALYDIGSVGKTHIAVEYAYIHKTDYKIVWWLRSEETSTLLSDYAQLATKLYPESGEVKDLNIAKDAVKTWLKKNSEWLLIFDNAQKPEQIKDFLPDDGLGHVIITSRNQEWGALAQNFPINSFPRDESIKFILNKTNQLDNEAANKLAQELFDLPLALEYACSYIKESEITISNYLECFTKYQAITSKQNNPAELLDMIYCRVNN